MPSYTNTSAEAAKVTFSGRSGGPSSQASPVIANEGGQEDQGQFLV
jgi:hypothetical protein